MPDNREFLKRLYNERPDLFTDEDRALLEDPLSRYLRPTEIPARYGGGGDDPLAVAKQALAGLVSGLTAMPSMADQPKTEIEDIVYGLGHLVGFAGLFPGLGTATSLAAKGVRGAAAGLGVIGAKAGVRGMIASEKVLGEAAHGLGLLAAPVSRFRSAPMMVADLAMKRLEALGPAEAARTYLMGTGGGRLALSAIQQGTHLGIASAVSSANWVVFSERNLSDTVKDAMNAAAYGGVFGGVFGGGVASMWKIPWMSQPTTMAAVGRAIAGSLAQGLPSTLEGQPTHMQIYSYLMGGVFGLHTPSAETYLAARALHSYSKDPLGQFRFNYHSEDGKIDNREASGYNKLPKEVQRQVDYILEKSNRPMTAGAAMIEILRNFMANESRLSLEDILKLTPEELSARLSRPFVGKTGDRVVVEEYHDPVTGERKSPIGTAIRVSGDGTNITVKFDDGYYNTYTNAQVRLLAKKMAGTGTKPEDTANASQEDFEPLAASVSGGVFRRATAFKTGKEEVAARDVEGFMVDYDRIIMVPESERGYREDIKDLVFGGKKEEALDPEQKDMLNELVQMYHIRKYGTKRRVGHYDAEKGFVIDDPLDVDSDVVFDADNNRINIIGPEEWRPDMISLSWVRDPKGPTQVQSFKEFPMNLTRLGHLFQTAWANGYIPISARADHAEIRMGKPNWTADMAGEWLRVERAMRASDPDFETYYKMVRTRDASMGFTEEQTRAIMISRARDLEKFFFGDYDPSGANLERLLKRDPAVTAVVPKNLEEFSGMYPDFRITDATRLSEEDFRADTGMEAWAQEFKGGKWVGSSVTQGARIPGPDLFPSYGHWLMYKGERNRLQSIIPPSEGEHAGDYVTRISRVAYERMLARSSDKVSERGFIPNAAALNKRLQLIDHRMYPGDLSLLSPTERDQMLTGRVLLIHDYADNTVSADYRRVGVEYSDGGGYVPLWFMKSLLKMFGQSETDGHAKVFIQHRDPANGTGLYKPLLQPYSAKLQSALEKQYGEGIVLMPLSSAKAYGSRKVYHLHTEGDRVLIFDEAGNLVTKPETYQLNASDIGNAFSVHDPKVSDRIQLSKSIITVWKRFQVGDEADQDGKLLIDSGMRGTEEGNKALREYIANPTKENLSALDPHFFDMDKELLLSQIKADDNLMASLVRRLVLRKDEYIGEGDDMVEWDNMVREAYGDKRWVAMTGGDPSMLVTNKATKDLLEHAVTRFLLGSMTRPWVRGTKAFVSLLDPMEIRNMNLTDFQDTIYLTRNQKYATVEHGIDETGREKRMKLHEQLEVREKVLKARPVDWERTLERIDRSLMRIVERDPMDDATGLMSLRIAGFIDRPGNGVFIAGENFKRFSGMDGDGDTVNIYELPESFHKAARAMSEQYARLQDKYPEGEKLWYSKDNPEIVMSGSPSAMLDATAMIQLGLEVSKGRGFLMGWHSAMKHSVLTILDNLRPDGTYVSPVYFDRRERSGTYVKFAARGDKEAAMQLMTHGSHVFVDVAKKGTLLPSKQDIMMYDVAAAFDAIYVDRGEGGKGSYLINLVKAFSPDGSRFILDKDNTEKLQFFVENVMWKTDIGLIREANRKFYRNNLLERRPFSFNEVTDAASRYPVQIHDLLSEIASNMRPLRYSEGILNRVLPYYETFLGNARMWDKQMMEDTEKKKIFPFLRRTFAPQFEAMLSRLQIVRMHYRPDLPEKPFNWATERGLFQMARYGAEDPTGQMRLVFKDFFRVTAREHEKRYYSDRKARRASETGDPGYSMQDYLEHLASDVMRGASNKWYALDKETQDDLRVIFEKKTGGVVRKKTLADISEEDLDRAVDILFDSKAMQNVLWKMRYLRSYVDQVEDFLTSRFRDMAGVEELYRVYRKNNITSDVSRYLNEKISEIKQNYGMWHSRKHYERMMTREGRRKKWTPEVIAAKIDAYDTRSEAMHRTLGTPEAVKRQMDDLMAQMEIRLKEQESRGFKVPEIEQVKEYAYSILASSLDPYTGHTRHYQRIDEIIPAQIMKAHLEMTAKLFSSFEKKSDPKEFRAFWDKIRESMPSRAEAERQYKDYHAYTNLLMGKVTPGTTLDEPTKIMVREIVDIIKGMPEMSGADPTDVWEMIRPIVRKAQPRDVVSYTDLKALRNTLVGAKTGPGMIRWLLRGGPDKWRAVAERYRNGKPLTFWDRLGFITTTADHMRVNDLSVLQKRLFSEPETEATLASDLSPERMAFQSIGREKIEYIYGNARVPVSHAQVLIDINRMAAIAPEQVDNMDVVEVGKLLGPLLKVVDSAGKDRHLELLEIAEKLREVEGQKRKLRSMVFEDNPRKYAEEQENLRRYQRRNLDSAADWKKYEKKVFTLPLHPGKPTATGREVIEMMVNASEKVFKDYAFDTKIAATPEQIKEYILVGKNNRVNVQFMLRKIVTLIREQVVKKQIPADIVRMMEYFNDADMHAKDGVGRVMVPDRDTVEKMRFGVMEEMQSVFPDFARNVMQARVWTAMYIKRLYDPEGSVDLSRFREPELRNAAERGLRAAMVEIDAVGAEKARTHEHKNTQLVYAAKDYINKHLLADKGPESDVRFMVFGMRAYSQYEMDRKLARKDIGPEDWLYMKTLDENAYSNTGEREGYWPHLNWYEPTLRKWISEQAELIKNTNMERSAKEHALAELVEYDNQRIGMDLDYDGHVGAAALARMEDGAGSRSRIERSLELQASLSPNQLSRRHNMDGYSYKPDAIMTYLQRLNRATYKRLALMIARNVIHDFEAKKPMGEYTKQWADWLRIYTRTSLGGPSLFTDKMLSDPRERVRRTPYYWMSDQYWGMKGMKIYATWLKLSGAELMTDAEKALFEVQKGHTPTGAEIKDITRKKLKALVQPTEDNLIRAARVLHNFSLWEGRYEMATLLAHSKTGVSNILGGTINDWVWNGARAMISARDIKVWREIGPPGEWKTMSDVKKAFFTKGIIEDFITKEASLLGEGARKGDWKGFSDAISKKLAKDPDAPDGEIRDLVKLYGINESVYEMAGWVMRKSERMLRINSGLAAYLNVRWSMEPMAVLEWDNPYLLDVMKRSIAASQYLYGAETRPVWASTNVGKIFSRFKLWAWSSVKFRRQVFEEARNAGYAAGTTEFERLQRMMMADLFMMGLATLLPYTILDYGLPAPLSYFQNLQDWLMGDEKQKERAFFISNTGLPQAVAPLNELMPVIARWPKGVYDIPGTFAVIWGGDLNKLGEYTTYSLFPFGRISKDLARSIDNPSFAVDALVGFPSKRLGQTRTRLMKEGNRRQGHRTPIDAGLF